MNYYLKVLQNYATFSGRARRSEYWYFTLFNFIIAIVVGFVNVLTKMPISTIYYLAVLIPTIAVGVRRMHDVGKSGWFILIPIYNLILACTDGINGDNEYGADPKMFQEMKVFDIFTKLKTKTMKKSMIVLGMLVMAVAGITLAIINENEKTEAAEKALEKAIEGAEEFKQEVKKTSDEAAKSHDDLAVLYGTMTKLQAEQNEAGRKSGVIMETSPIEIISYQDIWGYNHTLSNSPKEIKRFLTAQDDDILFHTLHGVHSIHDLLGKEVKVGDSVFTVVKH